MNEVSKTFLERLLSTASPSGDEIEIQKKWKEYVEGFADEIRTDNAGNVIAILNPEKPFKVMLAGHVDEIAFMVTHIDDKGFLSVTKVGGINPKLALAQRVKVLGANGIIKGVIGVNAQHHGGEKGEIEVESLYIDLGANSKEEAEDHVTVGDYVVYDMDYEYLLNNKIAARGLDNRAGAFIVAEVVKRLAQEDLNVGIYGVSTVNEETNMGGAFFAASAIEPTCGLACDVTFTSDYGNTSKKKLCDIALDKGPVLAKGAQINKKLNGILIETAKKNDIPVQFELTPRTTGTDADKIRFTGKGTPVALVSLPLRYMHSPSEVVSLDDMEKMIELMVLAIKNLKGNESFNPFE